MNKKIAVLGLLLLSFCMAQAHEKGNENRQWFYGIQGHITHITAHHPDLKPFSGGLSPALELNVGFRTLGLHKWEHHYNFPSMGIGYYRSQPGQRQVLGKVNSAFLFLEFNTRERKNYETFFKYSLGLAHFSNPHHPDTNPENQAIATPFNVHFNANYTFAYRLSPQIKLASGVSFTHFSNGAYKKPNKGLNILDVNLGIRHFPGEPRQRHATPEFGKSMQQWPSYRLHAMYSVGKMQKVIEPDQYMAHCLTVEFARQSHYTNRWGVGLNVFYDDFLKAQAREEFEANSFKNYLHGAVHILHDVVFHRLWATFQLGYYAFYYVEPYKPIFQRVGLRYQFDNGIMAGVSLKTHYTRADVVEWGVGYRIL